MRIQSGFNGKRLKAARLYRGLTISEVAKMSDVSKQAISQFENSKAEPKLETLMKIMQILKFPREYFYENPEDKVEKYGICQTVDEAVSDKNTFSD